MQLALVFPAFAPVGASLSSALDQGGLIRVVVRNRLCRTFRKPDPSGTIVALRTFFTVACCRGAPYRPTRISQLAIERHSTHARILAFRDVTWKAPTLSHLLPYGPGVEHPYSTYHVPQSQHYVLAPAGKVQEIRFWKKPSRSSTKSRSGGRRGSASPPNFPECCPAGAMLFGREPDVNSIENGVNRS